MIFQQVDPLTAHQNLLDAAFASLACEASTGLPALVSMGQWAIESGWGAHTPGNNCFGIKVYAGSDKQLLATEEWMTEAQREQWLKGAVGRVAVLDGAKPKDDKGRGHYLCKDWFAKFPTLTACFVKHAQLITSGKPYARAWAAYQLNKDANQLAIAIGPIYATDGSYGKLLVSMMTSKRIESALAQVRTMATLPTKTPLAA